MGATLKDMSTATGEAPHPTMSRYYTEDSQRAAFVRQLFDDTAGQYDRINTVFSLGTGEWYRRHALRRAGLGRGDRVLDVAVGTGLTARAAAAVTGDAARVVGLDPSAGMLAEARRSLSSPLVQGRAEALPLASESMDFLSMGYALRHVSDLAVTFAEFRRVLRPGGTLVLLEIGRPDRPLARWAARAYLGGIVPFLCRLAVPGRRSGTLMQYYWETIDACVPAERILSHLHDGGFANVRCETALGLFRSYIAQRPV